MAGLATSCHDPVGAYASYENGQYTLRACFGFDDESRVAVASKNSTSADEELIKSVVAAIKKDR